MERIIFVTDYHQRKNNDQTLFDKKVSFTVKCHKPWEKLIINQFGESYICESPAWLPKTVGLITDFENIFDLLNSYEAQSIRAEILNNRYSYCNSNICGGFFSGLNKNNYQSQNTNNDFSLLDSSYFNEQTKVTALPNEIIFDFDYTCNFVCPSCRTTLINNNKGPIAEINDRIVEKIKHLIIDNISSPTVFRWAGGEPFISRAYLDLWEYIVNSKNKFIKNIIQTNGSYLRKKEDLLLEFLPYVSEIRVSFDAGSEEIYKINRVNGDWATLLGNSKWLVDRIKENNFNTKCVSNFVVQLNNFKEIPEYVKIAKQIGFDRILLAKLWNWDTWGKDEFDNINVSDKLHPQYNEFLNIIKLPEILQDKTVIKGYWHNELHG